MVIRVYIEGGGVVKNHNICGFFGLLHLVMSTVGSNLTKLNTGEQLQTFPYPKTLKSFLYSNAFMVIFRHPGGG